MPVSCSSSALTGQEGSVFFTPAGTRFCLLDFTDFPAGDAITVPAQHDFRVGDPVVFEEENGGSLCDDLTAGDQYYVVATTATTIGVSTAENEPDKDLYLGCTAALPTESDLLLASKQYL